MSTTAVEHDGVAVTNGTEALQSRGPPADSRPVAVLTCAGLDQYKDEECALMAALEAQSIAAQRVRWDEPNVQWASFRAAVIRSTWGYHKRPSEFLQTLERIHSAGVPLLNSVDTVRWNHHKRYLRDLAALGVPTVDTLWVEMLSREAAGLGQAILERGWTDGVIKPAVSAGGMHTFRFSLAAAATESAPSSVRPFAAVLADCVATGVQQWLVQPFCHEVLEEGEWSFVFLNGDYSHCLLSTPAGAVTAEAMLALPTSAASVSDIQTLPLQQSAEELFLASQRRLAAAQAATSFMVQPMYGGTHRLMSPTDDLREQARLILHATAHGRHSLYARVDCLRRGEQLVLTELELIEPYLYARNVEGFFSRFVQALEQRIIQRRSKL